MHNHTYSRGHDSTAALPDLSRPVSYRKIRHNRSCLFERAGFIACTPEALEADEHLRALFCKWMGIFEEVAAKSVEQLRGCRRKIRAKAEQPVFMDGCFGIASEERIAIGFDPLSGVLYVSYTVNLNLQKPPFCFRDLSEDAIAQSRIVIK